MTVIYATFGNNHKKAVRYYNNVIKSDFTQDEVELRKVKRVLPNMTDTYIIDHHKYAMREHLKLVAKYGMFKPKGKDQVYYSFVSKLIVAFYNELSRRANLDMDGRCAMYLFPPLTRGMTP